MKIRKGAMFFNTAPNELIQKTIAASRAFRPVICAGCYVCCDENHTCSVFAGPHILRMALRDTVIRYVSRGIGDACEFCLPEGNAYSQGQTHGGNTNRMYVVGDCVIGINDADPANLYPFNAEDDEGKYMLITLVQALIWRIEESLQEPCSKTPLDLDMLNENCYIIHEYSMYATAGIDADWVREMSEHLEEEMMPIRIACEAHEINERQDYRIALREMNMSMLDTAADKIARMKTQTECSPCVDSQHNNT